jgi:transcriptional regulator with XRE-family HTH domain
VAIGDRIKRSREFKKITQEELADRLGVQRNTIWRWENEKAFPTKPIVEIAQALSVSTL